MEHILGKRVDRKSVSNAARRGRSNRSARKYLRRIILSLSITVSLICVVGYVFLSLADNSLPPVPYPSGWLGLMQQTSEPQVDQVSVTISAIYGGYSLSDFDLISLFNHDGELPPDGYVAIVVSACGPRPYNAELLLFDFLDSPTVLDEEYAGDPSIGESVGANYGVVRSRNLGITFGFGGGTSFSDQGTGQDVSIRLAHVLPCSSPINTHSQVEIGGMAVTPWWKSSSGLFGLWRSPHASLSTPMIGEIPGVYGSEPFTVGDITGKWEQSSRMTANIDVSTSGAWFMDSAVPAPSVANNPTWSSQRAFSPSAQFTNRPFVAASQDWIVLFAVGLGIGGGLASSLIFEYLRAKPTDLENKPSPVANKIGTVAPVSSSSNSRFAVTGTIFLIFYILRRRRR